MDINDISLIAAFSVVPNPRIDRQKKHKLIDIIVITVCAVLCDCDSWDLIEDFGVEKEEWFKKFIDLPNGIPSHDTFRRVFQLLSFDAFQEAFITWTDGLRENREGDSIAIDGKNFTGRLTRPWVKMPSAW